MPNRVPPYHYELGEFRSMTINETLGLTLPDGNAILTPRAHKHAAGHDIDARTKKGQRLKEARMKKYLISFPQIGQVISSPQFVELRKVKKSKRLGIVSEVSVEKWPLIVVLKMPDNQGLYRVSTFYPLGRTQLNTRLKNGAVKALK